MSEAQKILTECLACGGVPCACAPSAEKLARAEARNAKRRARATRHAKRDASKVRRFICSCGGDRRCRADLSPWA